MKQTAMDSSVFFLPHEIIRNILKRLPVKSLIRFQCVCKDWKNLIQNPSFIADHLQQSTHQNPSLLLECNGINIPLPWRLNLMDCGLQVRGVQNSTSNHYLRNNASIVGSCNGLLCLEIYQFNQSPHSLSLWNPATTEVRHVPKTITDFDDFDDGVTGFGFSPIVNDYKIVRTFADFYSDVIEVEVFSLNRGTWKAIDIGNLKGVKLNSETITANGAIFWSWVNLVDEKKENIDFHEDEDYIQEAEYGVDVIVSFDIAKEVFTVIPWPELGYDVDVKLTVYENKLAILCDTWEDEAEIPFVIDLWVLYEGTCASGETWSWTKRYTSSPLSCRLVPATIWRNEIVYVPGSKEHDDEGRINVLYMMNLTTNEVKRSVIPNRDSILGIYNYVESLVSVGNNYIEES
ncbi:hypothetical protein QN277_009161 [Acacia crassicarpa]|uniref:F-box domain-containing protein n=1 Tax=Acacia crassicarpa TaxID=499986 RepID=A0AAE1IT89_9FABA|nr:hypothetical protein QN277_009161 [Acacia crassicarpa]